MVMANVRPISDSMQQASQLGYREIGVRNTSSQTKQEACMLYVGLDVHSRQSSLCILNSAGGTVNQIQLKGPRAAVVDRLRQLHEPFSICYEASCGYGHLYEQLRPLAGTHVPSPIRASCG